MTQCDRIRALLSDGRWHSMRELNRICYRYSARLYDLAHGKRPMGHEVRRGADGARWYRRAT